MEECEALCTRLAIMVNGQFKCLGATQHLKSKFGEGYTLMAKVGLNQQGLHDPNQLMAFIEKTFTGCQLKEVHQGLVHYQINRSVMTWAEIFGTMERAKEEYNIEDYSVSQTTLEQVFINFARAQIEPEDKKSKCCSCLGSCCSCCACCREVSEIPVHNQNYCTVQIIPPSDASAPLPDASVSGAPLPDASVSNASDGVNKPV